MSRKLLIDNINESTEITVHLDRILASGRTAFQEYRIASTQAYGRVLILDGRLQSAEVDELVYHEGLVHPALMAHPSPQRVYIGGGGEGATLREVLRYGDMRAVRMVDIDRELVEACRRHLPMFHRGAYDDPRVELIHDDARRCMDASDPWDVILFDITEPMEGSPAIPLFSVECFEEIASHLAPRGVFALQAGSVNMRSFPMFAAVVKTLARVFPAVFPYQILIQSFFEPWGFVLAMKDGKIADLPMSNFAESARIRVEGPLMTLNQQTYESFFAFEPRRRAILAEQACIITDSAPLALTAGCGGVSSRLRPPRTDR